MISQVSFLIWDKEQDKAVTDEDDGIEYEYDNGKLKVWRTKGKTFHPYGGSEVDRETRDPIDDFEIIKLTEL